MSHHSVGPEAGSNPDGRSTDQSTEVLETLEVRWFARGRLPVEVLGWFEAAVPDVEIEVFVHGAMCLAYSGRCLLSAWSVGRSGNQGDCAHSCRWEYRVGLEEKKRPGEFLPVEQGDGYSTIMSPKDLCMIGHIPELIEAGADSYLLREAGLTELVAAVEGTRFLFESWPGRRTRVAVLEGRVRCLSKTGSWEPVRLGGSE